MFRALFARLWQCLLLPAEVFDEVEEDLAAQHGDSGKPTWANERICVCGETYRVMPPGPSLQEHIDAHKYR